ncbi:Uncharacterised protein [Vibrio cholerae]|nr:Uncharacterised protein [Vibrio cholerae]
MASHSSWLCQPTDANSTRTSAPTGLIETTSNGESICSMRPLLITTTRSESSKASS